MLRDVVKLGLVTGVGLGVVATVGVGVGIATLIAGAIFAGISSAEPPRNETTGTSNGGSTPKVDEKKLPKEGKPSSPHVSRSATTDITLESKSNRSPVSKTSVPNGRDERKVPTPPATNVKTSDRAPEGKYSAPNGRDERQVPTPPPNRKRSSSVVLNKPGDATASSKEDVPHVDSNDGTALSEDKPSSLSRELEAQIAPEINQWRNERPSNQESRKRGTLSGRGSTVEKRSPPAVVTKTDTVPVPEPSASVNAPGPLPLLPPKPIPKPKSTPHLSEAIDESQPKPSFHPASVPVPIKEEKPISSQNGILQDEVSLSKPGDRAPVPSIGSKLDTSPPLQAVLAQDSQSEVPVPLPQQHPAVTPSSTPVFSVPLEESTVLAADAVSTSSNLPLNVKLEAVPTSTTTDLSGVVPNGLGVLQGPASASRDSLTSVQRRNSKLASAAKRVSHSVRRVFKGPDGKVIHTQADPQRLTSSSSDSVDSQRFTTEPEQALLNGRALSKLASSSRESFASTKSRRSLIDGTKKSLKRMFKGSSDNLEVPPVPPLPGLTSTVPEPSVNSEKSAVVPSTTPAPKPAKSFSSKNSFPGPQQQQQPHASVSNQAQNARNAPGAPDTGNNASPLLKGMFKGRATPRVRR